MCFSWTFKLRVNLVITYLEEALCSKDLFKKGTVIIKTSKVHCRYFIQVDIELEFSTMNAM